MLGSISKITEPPQIHANHTNLDPDMDPPATITVTMEKDSESINVLLAQLLKPPHQIKSNLKSTKTVQWKLLSPFTKTSSNTRVVSINTPQVAWLVDTPSRSSVGVKKTESTTGSVLTPGVPAGEKVDSSESLGDNAALTVLPMPAHLNSDEL